MFAGLLGHAQHQGPGDLGSSSLVLLHADDLLDNGLERLVIIWQAEVAFPDVVKKVEEAKRAREKADTNPESAELAEKETKEAAKLAKEIMARLIATA